MKQIQTFEDFLNEGFSIEGDGGNINAAQEKRDAAGFKWMPKQFPITVKDLEMDLPDDYNGDVTVTMSNGDVINYELAESRTPVKGQRNPPFYSFSLKVNGKELTDDSDDVLKGGTSIVGDILNYYVKNYLNIKYK